MELTEIMNARIGALESRVANIELQLATAGTGIDAKMVATETKPKHPKRGTNPRGLTEEQRATKAEQLRRGKEAAKAKREAEAKISPQVKAIVETAKAEAAKAQAEADAKKDMAAEATKPKKKRGAK